MSPHVSPPNRNNPASGVRRLLRRADQITVAAITLVGLVALGLHWVHEGGLRGRLVEVDRAPAQSSAFLVDVNRAEWPELAQLPGIGQVLAQRIVAERATLGPFLDHQDLRRVRGIGSRTLERIEPYLLPMPEAGSVAGR
jgi:competence protein ComEA